MPQGGVAVPDKTLHLTAARIAVLRGSTPPWTTSPAIFERALDPLEAHWFIFADANGPGFSSG